MRAPMVTSKAPRDNSDRRCAIVSTENRSALSFVVVPCGARQKRLSSLDPTTTSGRNRKQVFEIAVLAQQVLDGHAGELQRHGVSAAPVRVIPNAKAVEVKMVKGMVIQVLENLLSNSIYWLKPMDFRFRIGIKWHVGNFRE